MHLAIIPARGGSKGVPGKNLQRVGGVPLVARAVYAAQAAANIDMVVVSSDDEEILAAAKRAGANLLARPAEHATDEASSESVLLHALDTYPHATIVTMLQCTSPFIDAKDVEGTVQKVIDGADCAFTAAQTHGFLWRELDGAAAGVNHNPSNRPRRQEREPEYLETGAVYAMRADGFREAKHRFFGRIAMHVVPASRAIEIDTPDELETAQAIAHFHPPVEIGELSKVGLVVLDFDGVLTDNMVWTDAEGGEQVRCSRGDGMGVSMLRAAGIPVEILSKERHPVVAARAAKMRIPVTQGIDDKGPVLEKLAQRHGITMDNVAYVGNDVNDLVCLERVGLPIAVADAHPRAKAAARWILSKPGGAGAVRELCEALVAARSEDA